MCTLSDKPLAHIQESQGGPKPNLNAPSRTEAPPVLGHESVYCAVYISLINYERKKNYKCISCTINWHVLYYTKFHLKGLHSCKKCLFGWLSSSIFMLTIHLYTHYVYWVHAHISCCHSQTVSAYVFVILHYSNSELQLSSLELIFSYMPFMHYS